MSCIAISTVIIRITICFFKLAKFYPDDFILIIASTTIIGVTVVVNLLLPYNQTLVNVGFRLIPPPGNLNQTLDYETKLQDSFFVLAIATIFAVKFHSLPSFARYLGRRGD